MLGRFRHLSMKAKFFLIIFVFLFVPFLIVGMVWSEKWSQNIENVAVNYNQVLVDQIQGQVDGYFADLAKDMSPLLIHPLVTSFLNSETDDSYTEYQLAQQFQAEIQPGIMYSREEIYGITVVSPSGYRPLLTKMGSVVKFFGQYDRNELYARVLEMAKRKDHFMEIVGSGWSNQIPIVSLVLKTKNNAATGMPEGLLLIDINVSVMAQLFRNLLVQDTGFIWIADEDGKVVFHPERSRIGVRLADEEFARYRGNSQDYFISNIEGVKKLVYYSRSDYTEWIFISEIPFIELTENLADMRSISVVFAIAMVAIALLVVAGLSLSVTGSLTHLLRQMRKVESGIFHVRVGKNKLYREIDTLNQGFNKMIDEIHRLIEIEHRAKIKVMQMEVKQQQSLLRIMQTQINPHFLYNTLEVINSHAIVAKVAPISRMVAALSMMFRYSMRYSHETVTLQQELEHVRMYLTIQSERDADFRYDWDVADEETIMVRALSLILQPVVENAFIHGYEDHKLPIGYIGVRGTREGEDYAVIIADHGAGMNEEVRVGLNRMFEREDIAEHEIEDSRRNDGGIGLWNVHARIRLTFGAPYGLTIAKSDSAGTEVRIRLPGQSSGGE